MKKFSTFVRDINKKVLKSVIPNMYIQHGSHSNTNSNSNSDIPNLYIQHGSHSLDKKLKEETRVFTSPDEYKREAHFKNNHGNEHLGKTINDVHHYLKNLHDVNNSTTQEEKNALMEYSGSSSGLNRHLIAHNGVSDEHTSDYYRGNVKGLDSAIAKHTLPKMILHSGIGWNPEKETNSQNRMFRTSAYTSSSIDPNISRGFAKEVYEDPNAYGSPSTRHMLRIHVPAGQKGIHLGNSDDNSPITSHNEHEVILPRNTTYKINKVPAEIHKSEWGSPLHVWDAHIVPHGEDPHTWEPPKK